MKDTLTANLCFIELLRDGQKLKVLHQLVNRADGITSFWQEVPTVRGDVEEPSKDAHDAQRQ